MFIMASQKSAPVAVTVISYIASEPATQGLLAIPCVVGQISQIFVGSAIARYFAVQVEQYKAQQRQAKEEQERAGAAAAAAAEAAVAAGDEESQAAAGRP